MTDKELSKFFNLMYDEFGQWAVMDFILARQSIGQLRNVKWKGCEGCEVFAPFLKNNCLVCGGR
jgi:hypothetical protein